jgi:hypothetical protein
VIPVLICPVINRFDLLERLLRSIDHPVKQVVIVDNSCSGYEVPEDIDLPVGYIRPFTGIGYGGAINQGIMQTAYADWWLWASNDVEFHPGHLASVAKRMYAANDARIITGGFTWAAVNPDLIYEVGLVDEWSFFPIYYDDNDYHYRCTLANAEWIEDWDNGSNHGEGNYTGSMVINSDENIKNKNHRSFRLNNAYYLAKWGGEPGKEVFKSPFDSGLPVWYTRPDIRARAQRMW